MVAYLAECSFQSEERPSFNARLVVDAAAKAGCSQTIRAAALRP